MSKRTNSEVDDISDAGIFLKMWLSGLRLQEDRLGSEDGKLAIEIRFAIFASNIVVDCCRMFERHQIPGVDEALTEFETRQPSARQLRNALEHLDAYLRGEGRGAKNEPNWFPIGSGRDDEGRAWIGVPPLGGEPAQKFDVSQLIHDTLLLATQVEKHVHDDAPRRLRLHLEAMKGESRPPVAD